MHRIVNSVQTKIEFKEKMENNNTNLVMLHLIDYDINNKNLILLFNNNMKIFFENNLEFFNIWNYIIEYSFEILIFLPLVVFFLIQFIKIYNLKFLRYISLFGSFIIFFFSLINMYLLIISKNLQQELPFRYFANYFTFYSGIDYLVIIYDSTLVFLVITAFITFICNVIALTKNYYKYKLLISLFFILEFLSFHFFITGNLLFLYIYFEATIIPTFILIGLWGTKIRRNIAFYYIYFITGFGSVLMLGANMLLYNKFGTLNTLELALYSDNMTIIEKHLTWILLMLCFIIKLPGFLFYNWLLEAHVEAPVEGSAILSGYILKYSIWGIIAHVYLIFPEIGDFYKNYLSIIIFCSVVYSLLSALRTHDFKKCIAYTSISHMSIALLGLISCTSLGLKGCLIMTFAHSLTSPGLFIVAGLLYEKYSIRDIRFLGNITFPLSLFYFLLILTNIGFPGTVNFIAELAIFCSLLDCFSISNLLTIIFNVFVGALFGIWLLTRINFNNNANKKFSDLNMKESIALSIICCILLYFGLSSYLLNLMTNDLVMLHFNIMGRNVI